MATVENGIFLYNSKVPHDEWELSKLAELMRRLPDFHESLSEFEAELRRVGQHTSKLGVAQHIYELEEMVLRCFFAPLENRPFVEPSNAYRRSLAASIKVEGIIRRRNVSCEICGENRSTDRCHIVPNRLGGPATADNILILCPTHHRLFDRFMLSRTEFARVDWTSKSEGAQHYVESHTLPAHEQFWAKVERNEQEWLGRYGGPKDKGYFEFCAEKVLELFPDSKPLRRASIYKLLPREVVKIAKVLIPMLVKEGVLLSEKVGTVAYLARPTERPVPSSELIQRAWSRMS